MPCAPQSIDIKPLLSQVPLFAGMKAGELENVAAAAELIHAARGELLFRKGDACSGLHLVIYGQVKLFFASPEGHEKIVDIVDEGQTFGEAALFHGGSYQFHAQTLSDCLVLHIASTEIMVALARSPAFAHRMMDSLAQRLSELTADVESYSLDSGLQRVISYLLREARRVTSNKISSARARIKGRFGSAPASVSPHVPRGENAASFTLLTSKGVIASRLNLTQEHFSRMLHELSACGLLSVSGRDICINDLLRLRQYACRSGTLPELLRPELSDWAGKSASSCRSRGAQLEHQY